MEFYLLAAQSAAALFAHKEAAGMARRGLEMLRELPQSPERDRQELILQLTLGRSVSVTSGYTEPEASSCFTRAKELAPILGEEADFFPAIWGLWMSRVIQAETSETADLSQQLESMARNSSDAVLLAGGHYAIALQFVITGNLLRARDYLEEVISLGGKEKNQVRVSKLVLDPVASAQGLILPVLWSLGYPDQARTRMKEALARIHTEKWDPRSMCDVLISASVIHKFCGNSSEVERLSTEVIKICDRYEFSVERTWALFNRGWALAATGGIGRGVAEMEESLDDLFSRGVMMITGTLYSSELAETFLKLGMLDTAHKRIREALSFVDRTGHRAFASELHRIEGDLLARASADAAAVEECFGRAMTLAREQQARSLELRAAASRARFRASLGNTDAALDVLSAPLDWFTEGFDTSDLLAARTLLKELR
jgi:tetratricopeptide (TPR) repeat protein